MLSYFHSAENCSPSYPWYINILFILAIVAAVWRVRSKHKKISLFLVCSGGILNSLERAITGCVNDYLQLPGLFHFNLSDVAILIGCLLLLYDLWSAPKSK